MIQQGINNDDDQLNNVPGWWVNIDKTKYEQWHNKGSIQRSTYNMKLKNV